MDTPNPYSAPEVFWYFVTHDGPAPWEVEGRRQIAFDDVKALAAAIDRLPYEGALLATTGHNVWVLGAAAAAITRKFKPLLAIRPQFISVTELANMAVSFNNLFDNRLLINVINSETPIWRQNGIWLENEQRFELHAEYWDVFQQLVAGEKVTWKGKHLHIEQAVANPWLPPGAAVPLWFSGSSRQALEVAARFADAYLTFAEPLPQLREKLDELATQARGYGRRPRLGLRASLILAETDALAWQKAQRLLELTSRATLERKLGLIARGGNAGGTSVTQSRIFAHLPARVLETIAAGRIPDARELSVDEHLWPGIALLQQGPPMALVGSYHSIAARLCEYRKAGIDIFILDSLPLLEGAYAVAEHVLPDLQAVSEQ
ncbi:TPA: LLM class flavin-dependent oxidoreductase [Raoultella planticola]